MSKFMWKRLIIVSLCVSLGKFTVFGKEGGGGGSGGERGGGDRGGGDRGGGERGGRLVGHQGLGGQDGGGGGHLSDAHVSGNRRKNHGLPINHGLLLLFGLSFFLK